LNQGFLVESTSASTAQVNLQGRLFLLEHNFNHGNISDKTKTKGRIEKKSEGRIGRTYKESMGEYAEANCSCALLVKFG